MSVDQLLPQILALEPFEREQLIQQICESLGERDGHFVSDSEVNRRAEEIENNPDKATLSREEFVAEIESRRQQRRSSD